MANQMAIRVEMPAGLEALVPDYLNSQKEEVRNLIVLVSAGELEDVRRAAHNLKGNGAAFGFPELTQFGADMERSAQEADVVALRQQLRNLADYLDRVQLW